METPPYTQGANTEGRHRKAEGGNRRQALAAEDIGRVVGGRQEKPRGLRPVMGVGLLTQVALAAEDIGRACCGRQEKPRRLRPLLGV